MSVTTQFYNGLFVRGYKKIPQRDKFEKILCESLQVRTALVPVSSSAAVFFLCVAHVTIHVEMTLARKRKSAFTSDFQQFFTSLEVFSLACNWYCANGAIISDTFFILATTIRGAKQGSLVNRSHPPHVHTHTRLLVNGRPVPLTCWIPLRDLDMQRHWQSVLVSNVTTAVFLSAQEGADLSYSIRLA